MPPRRTDDSGLSWVLQLLALVGLMGICAIAILLFWHLALIVLVVLFGIWELRRGHLAWVLVAAAALILILVD